MSGALPCITLCFLLWVPRDHDPDAMTFQEPEESLLGLFLSGCLSKQRKVVNITMLLVYVFIMVYFLAFEYSCLKQFTTKCSAHTLDPTSLEAEDRRPSIGGSLRHMVRYCLSLPEDLGSISQQQIQGTPSPPLAAVSTDECGA